MRSTCPCWVPGPMVRCCGPSSVSTSVSVPSAAWATLMVSVVWRLSPWRSKRGSGSTDQVDEERAARATALPGRATLGEPQRRPFLHTGGHLHREGALLHAAPLAAAVGAGVGDHLAGAVAARAGNAGHDLPEQRLAHPAQLARALAVDARHRLGAGGGAPTLARGARGRQADGDLLAGCRTPPRRTGASRRTSASAPTWGPRRRTPAPPIWPKNASKMSPRPPSKPKPPAPPA